MKRMYVKPRDGIKVLTEKGSPIPEEGRMVNDTTYYRRRIKDGDLIKLKKAPIKKKTTKEKE